MPYWMIYAEDKKNALDARLKARPEHLEYLQSNGEGRIIKMAFGTPLGDQIMDGSLLVVEAESIDAVESFSENDPYNKAGVFEKVMIRPVHSNFQPEKFLK